MGCPAVDTERFRRRARPVFINATKRLTVIDAQHSSTKSVPVDNAETSGGAEAAEPYVTSADTLKGEAVFNRERQRLGKVDKIILDVPGGRIAYAVLVTEDDIGRRLLAVPWGALQSEAGGDCFVLDVTRDELAHAPAFDEGNWPSMADTDWAREVHTYYRARPYYWS